ncbi:MAG: hypothetical protein GX096_01485 [Clostridiales bacterium]|nr:hypothetical protein [Clostridiales bacterium]
MANLIQLASSYVPVLDEIYQEASKTAILDGNPELVQAGANANELVIPMMTMDGLAEYSRNSGYVSGDVSVTNQTKMCNFDRGRKFTVDSMDDAETAGIAFGQLAGEFIRTKVVPELDAFRFASYAGLEGINQVAGDLDGGEAVIGALRAAATKMDEDEVPMEERHLFITPTLYGAVQDLDTSKSREVLSRYETVTLVPQSRFVTAIEQLDGKSAGEEMGGYKIASGAKNINFMVVHKSAVIQFSKHVAPKIIPPEINTDSDGWLYGYRQVGIAEGYKNKVAGICVHHGA